MEKLAIMVFDLTSDGYDDEENREETTVQLIAVLERLDKKSTLRNAIFVLCDTIEELL